MLTRSLRISLLVMPDKTHPGRGPSMHCTTLRHLKPFCVPMQAHVRARKRLPAHMHAPSQMCVSMLVVGEALPALLAPLSIFSYASPLATHIKCTSAPIFTSNFLPAGSPHSSCARPAAQRCSSGIQSPTRVGHESCTGVSLSSTAGGTAGRQSKAAGSACQRRGDGQCQRV